MRITKVQKKEITDKVKAKIKKLGLSAAKAAEQLQMNPGSLSLVLNYKWETQENLVSDERWMKLAQWVDYFSGWKTAFTPDFVRICNVCKHAQESGISRAIVHDPGSGKSYALREYANSHKDVFYIECEEYYTKKVFLRKLLQKMGVNVMHMTIGDMVDTAIDYLNAKRSPLVIIDEADKLKDNVLNFFKTFYNKTDAGFVLAGTPYFELRIDKGVRLNKMGFREIKSRIGGEFLDLYGLDVKVDGAKNPTVELVCKANGIVDPELIKEAENFAKKDLRRVKAFIDKIRLKQSKEAA